ncbi:MAG: ATP-binding cassette domain-containing protein [Actinomycetota bacterium]
MARPRRRRRGGDVAILAEDLHKAFGNVHALDGVDLSVREGTVLGLLGPNGAGKTTAVRILTTLLQPDGGRATVLGYDVVKEPEAVRRSIGLTGQGAAIDDNLTGAENLWLVGRLYHIPEREARARAGELLERFGLSHAADRPAKTYSGGMQRRLDLAASLVNRPPVLFLDEPTTGLDPASRIGLWEVIDDLVKEGATLLLTTQYLDEADHLAHRVSVVDHGKVIAEGTSDQLKRRIGREFIDLELRYKKDVDRALRALAPLTSGEAIFEELNVSIPVLNGTGVVAEAVRRLDKAKVKIVDLSVRESTLNDVFMTLTGHAAEEVEEGV